MIALAVFLAGYEQNAADGFDGAAFTSNEPAHVALSYTHLDPDVLTIYAFCHLDRVGFTNERGNDSLYRLFNSQS